VRPTPARRAKLHQRIPAPTTQRRFLDPVRGLCVSGESAAPWLGKRAGRVRCVRRLFHKRSSARERGHISKANLSKPSTQAARLASIDELACANSPIYSLAGLLRARPSKKAVESRSLAHMLTTSPRCTACVRPEIADSGIAIL
jgi:hypothetical protein